MFWHFLLNLSKIWSIIFPMAKKEKIVEQVDSDITSFADDLIKSLNKEFSQRVAYNLSVDEAPTIVKRWVSTGCTQLDYIIANRKNGGLPEGRIIEIFGPPSNGKSHIALQVCKSTQRMGGIVVYIDTENATSIENLASMGIDVSKRFVYVESSCTEEVFSIIESTIVKAKQLKKDVPITVVWDSIAATSPKAEIEGDYDQQTVGLQARVLSKGFRKITGVIGDNNVTLLCLNQTRLKIGVMHGDPTTTNGGLALPFHASVRIQLTGGSKVEDKDGNIIGINVIAKTVKNKVAAPHRRAEFKIMFGQGIDETEELFDLLRLAGPKEVEGDLTVEVSGDGAWKTFQVSNTKTGEIIVTKKFNKKDFGDVAKEYKNYMDPLIDAVLVKQLTGTNEELDNDDAEPN
jgi:recombination protein RecA